MNDSKTRQLGIIMDPIQDINIKKDSSFAMLLEAQQRGWKIHYMEPADLRLQEGKPRGRFRTLQLQDNPDGWHTFGEAGDISLTELDVILMRKDPPFDMEYIYCTYLLELAQQQESSVLVVNRPDSLRDCNEKLFTAWFPQCCAPTLVSRRIEDLRQFLGQHGHIVIKPLDGMGGQSVFVLQQGDDNSNVIFETLTHHGQRLAMAQQYIPEIVQGDKRILLIDGEPLPYALARVPGKHDHRGNLAAGAHAKGIALSDRDRWICAQLGSELRRRGLLFVGLDIIGDWLTEINVTSPTGIRELDALYDLNISARLFDAIERCLNQ